LSRPLFVCESGQLLEALDESNDIGTVAPALYKHVDVVGHHDEGQELEVLALCRRADLYCDVNGDLFCEQRPSEARYSRYVIGVSSGVVETFEPAASGEAKFAHYVTHGDVRGTERS
jgi:hypothetical protein